MGLISLGPRHPQQQTRLLEGRPRGPGSPVMPHLASQGLWALRSPYSALGLGHRSGMDHRPRVLESRQAKPPPGVFRREAPENSRMSQTESSCPNYES